VVVEVDELVRLVDELVDVGLFDRLDVAGAGVGREVRRERAVVVLGLGVDLLDRDARMGLLELLVQRLVPELAEHRDGEGELLVAAVATSARCGKSGDGHRGRGHGHRSAQP